jgi:DNA modification methylase
MKMTEPVFCFPPDLRPVPEILIGNCLEVLRTLPDQSIDCCVTSPPFFGLRDYKTGSWEGGDPVCTHSSGRGTNVRQTKHPNADNYPASAPHRGGDSTKCGRCGAIRIDEQIGLENTPAMYVEKLVKVFHEVRRVLKEDGTLWLNLGDSYSNDTKWGGASGGKHVKDLHGATSIGRNRVTTGLKPKDMIGIPWRVAFALQDDGWFLRSDIIWAKPNVMPESVIDRPTSSYEHVFLFTKNAQYFYDGVAIREPTSSVQATTERNGRADKGLVGAAALYGDGFGQSGNGGFERAKIETRNARNVWSIPTRPCKEAHFATMPPELAERCILAGTSAHGCCAVCGRPWRRQITRMDQGYDGSRYGLRARRGGLVEGVISGTAASTLGSSGGQLTGKPLTVGWEPSCGCAAQQAMPCTVLDPFGGAGTTGLVAHRLGRRSVLIELNPQYVDLARDRISNDKF